MQDVTHGEFIVVPAAGGIARRDDLPTLIQSAGQAGAYAWDEFFCGELSNEHTRRSYGRAVRQFLTWLEPFNIPLHEVTPAHVAGFLQTRRVSIPSRKLELAAIRRFFDKLVVRHVCLLNPALSVRGERYHVLEGRTPEILRTEVVELLEVIDRASIIGQRDYGIIKVLTSTAVRRSAIAKLQIGDLEHEGTQYVLRFEEKGGKLRAIPVRHDLERHLLEYLAARGIRFDDQDAQGQPMFPSVDWRTGCLTDRFLSGDDIGRIVKRRLRRASLRDSLSPHSFRAAVITDLLQQGVELTEAQNLAGHADPRTTRLYDRRPRQATRSLVERISI